MENSNLLQGDGMAAFHRMATQDSFFLTTSDVTDGHAPGTSVQPHGDSLQ